MSEKSGEPKLIQFSVLARRRKKSTTSRISFQLEASAFAALALKVDGLIAYFFLSCLLASVEMERDFVDLDVSDPIFCAFSFTHSVSEQARKACWKNSLKECS